MVLIMSIDTLAILDEIFLLSFQILGSLILSKYLWPSKVKLFIQVI